MKLTYEEYTEIITAVVESMVTVRTYQRETYNLIEFVLADNSFIRVFMSKMGKYVALTVIGIESRFDSITVMGA